MVQRKLMRPPWLKTTKLVRLNALTVLPSPNMKSRSRNYRLVQYWIYSFEAGDIRVQ